MRVRRARERDLVIPDVADPARRRRCEKKPELWLRTYLPHKFTKPFTANQSRMIDRIIYRAKFGGDQAIAAPRGEGKTSIVEGLMLFLVFLAILKFPIVIAATRSLACNILDNIKHELETNVLLREDYPEICEPIWALEGEPRRAPKQTVEGQPTRIKWQKYLVVLPTIEGSKTSGSAFAAFGLNGAIRGFRYVSLRPDFALADDPETDDSARNPKQVKKRRNKLDREVAGLAGQDATLARLALVTIQIANSLADELTDPKRSPMWDGMRFAMVEAMPDRMDLWEDYIQLVKDGERKGKDKDGRAAMAFYLKNRKAMDAGAKVGNEHRYISKPASDGTPLERSPLQHAFNWIARIGWDAFNSEFQNDPPKDTAPETLGITAELVASRFNDYPRYVLPSETLCITAHCDIGKARMHISTIAWLPPPVNAGLIIDYDRIDVIGAGKEKYDEAAKRAIYNALVNWRQLLLDPPDDRDEYIDTRGLVRRTDLAFIDSGDWHDVVYRFVKDVGGLPFVASKGFGDGPRSAPYQAGKANKDRIVGDRWWISRQAEHDIWLYGYDADYWKHQAHQAFLTPTFKDDRSIREHSLSLWQPERTHQHYGFGLQETADEWRELFVPDGGWKKAWVKIRKDNHWGDTIVMGCVAHDVWLTRMAPGRGQEEPKPSNAEAEEREVFRTPSGMPYLLTERNV